jgi:hypothetical protein
MRTKIVAAQEIRNVEISTLPMGEYQGVWGGYIATVVIDGKTYQFRTENGIRTIALPSIIRIQNGQADIKTIELVGKQDRQGQ